MPLQVTASTTSVADSAALYGALPNNTTCNSEEQIFSPIIIRKGAAGASAISGFETPKTVANERGQFGNDNVGPTRSELDPYFSNALGDDGSEWIKECDYQIMANDGRPNVGTRDINIRKTDRDISVVTAVALRGPIIVSGWGYDVCDRPVPHKRNNAGVQGNAGGAGTSYYVFDEKLVGDRGTWKTGPVNLQWDDERKVWQGGAQIVCGVLKGAIKAPTDPCKSTDFIVKVMRKMADSPDGALSSCVLGETITCQNRDPSLTQAAVKGMVFVVAVRINYEWIPLWVGCPNGPPPAGTPEDPAPVCNDC